MQFYNSKETEFVSEKVHFNDIPGEWIPRFSLGSNQIRLNL